MICHKMPCGISSLSSPAWLAGVVTTSDGIDIVLPVANGSVGARRVPWPSRSIMALVLTSSLRGVTVVGISQSMT